MLVDIITLLPGIFDNVFAESVLGAAVKNGLIQIEVHHFREYGDGKHRTVDDTAFGGGPGMILKPSPLVKCIRDVRKTSTRVGPVIGLTPQGVPLTQQLVKELAGYDRLILVCGRYEGFDERIISEFDIELSVGDYVMTGGEIAAMTIVDAVSRMIPGTVGCKESVEQDSFYQESLDHPQYTRPAMFEGLEVPTVLQEGNHALIEKYRRASSLFKTAVKRPDVLQRAELSEDDITGLQSLIDTSL